MCNSTLKLLQRLPCIVNEWQVRLRVQTLLLSTIEILFSDWRRQWHCRDAGRLGEIRKSANVFLQQQWKQKSRSISFVRQRQKREFTINFFIPLTNTRNTMRKILPEKTSLFHRVSFTLLPPRNPSQTEHVST